MGISPQVSDAESTDEEVEELEIVAETEPIAVSPEVVETQTQTQSAEVKEEIATETDDADVVMEAKTESQQRIESIDAATEKPTESSASVAVSLTVVEYDDDAKSAPKTPPRGKTTPRGLDQSRSSDAQLTGTVTGSTKMPSTHLTQQSSLDMDTYAIASLSLAQRTEIL